MRLVGCCGSAGLAAGAVLLLPAQAQGVTPSATPGSSLNVQRAVAVGHSPAGVAVDPATGTVFVNNAADGTVSVVPAGATSPSATVAVGAKPGAIAVDGALRRLYVANRSDGTLTVIDADTDAVLSTIPVGQTPGDDELTALAVDPQRQAVYLGDQNVSVDGQTVLGGALQVVDEQTEQVVYTSPLYPGPGTANVWDRLTVIQVDPESGTVYLYGATKTAEPAWWEEVLQNTAAPATLDDQVSELGASTSTGAVGFAVAPDLSRAYTGVFGGSVVAAFDPSQSSLSGHPGEGIHLPPAPPDALYYTLDSDTATHVLYVLQFYLPQSAGPAYPTAAAQQGALTAIDETTNAVLGALPVGGGPLGLAIDSAAHLIYVTQAGANQVTVIQSPYVGSTPSPQASPTDGP